MGNRIFSRKKQVFKKAPELSKRDRELFFDAIFADQEPDRNLIVAAQKYKSQKRAS